MLFTDSMTVEEILATLTEEFGDEFNWFLLPADNTSFANELKKELSADDPFLAGKIHAIAKCGSNDDVLFRSVTNDSCLLRIYHLTYSACNRSGFPKYVDFPDAKSVGEYLLEQR